MPTKALVFANGELNDGPAVQAALNAAQGAFVVAADGGARVAAACGVLPTLVVGDLDSLTETEVDALRARGVTVQKHPAEKDETDLELALLVAAEQANWIRVIGAWGGERIDQMLANLYLLTLPALEGCDVALVSGRQTVRLLYPGEHTLHGDAGDTVSLIALLPGVDAVTTEAMQYPLRGEALPVGPARGVSNVMLADEARVRFDGGLLIMVHTQGRA